MLKKKKKNGTGHTAHITEKRNKCVLIFRIFYLIMLFTSGWVSLTFYSDNTPEGHRMNLVKTLETAGITKNEFKCQKIFHD